MPAPTAPPSLRATFAAAHRDVVLFDVGEPGAVGHYLVARGLASPAELPARVEPAGHGNMNLTLRVTLGTRRLIVKQGRPWVEKYDCIAAPWDRTLVEAAFYAAVADTPAVAARMPAILHLDEHNRVLVLEDLGTGGDYTAAYADSALADGDLRDLLAWLAALAGVTPPAAQAALLTNRSMRELNHEHIFALPLREPNGIDLEALTPGLTAVAGVLKRDDAYRVRIAALGRVYLSDGASLVHGDYFPGSWIRTTTGVRVIDPEFGFLGVRELDYGTMLGHCALARTARRTAMAVMRAAAHEGLDEALVLGFAGAEIMRRLIGVAQLPVRLDLDASSHLLDWSRAFVLAPEQGLACWR